ncbi:MAG TPA: hypothetical protein VFM93_07865 [Candidatus Limnocylindria bacterium]|nr:hypothetical protein [Candidatus Limnocylindria bacterium]
MIGRLMRVAAASLAVAIVACGSQPDAATRTDAAPSGPTPTPTLASTPSPIPEAKVVAALPPPPEAPISAVLASPVEAAKTLPPPAPTPSPDPATWRVEGVIIADDSKIPLTDVCVVIGPRGCARGSPRTDGRGVFYFDVPMNPAVEYDLYFVKDGFWTVWMRIQPHGPSIYNVALTKR